MTRVLFTGGGGAGSQALASLLADRYDVHFADADADARPHGVSPDRWHVVPLARDPEFVPRLAALCESLAVNVVVPGVDEELAALALERGVLPPVLLPRHSFVIAHLDKLASAELLADVVKAPVTERADLRARVQFPCIAKPRNGRGSRGVVDVTSAWDLDAHIALARAGASEYVVQERLVGQEYTVTVVADATGQLRAVVPARVALKRGITIRASTTHDSAVMEVCEAIHDAFPVAGCYNVQGIRGQDGLFRPFELNPRVSTTACLAIAAGVDPIAIYLGKHPGDGLLPFREGVELRRSWHNEFLEAA